MSNPGRAIDLEEYFREAAALGCRIGAQQAQRSAWRAWHGASQPDGCLRGGAACALVLCSCRSSGSSHSWCASTIHTGIVDVVPAYDGQATVDEAVTRYFLTHYVTICERFNFSTAESDYEECGAFHAAQRNQAWYALWNANNPPRR